MSWANAIWAILELLKYIDWIKEAQDRTHCRIYNNREYSQEFNKPCCPFNAEIIALASSGYLMILCKDLEELFLYGINITCIIVH